MTERPDIANCKSAATFREWYYLKAELVEFARAAGLRTTGGKFEIADRIAHYLDHGTDLPRPKRRRVASDFDWHAAPLTDETVITDSYRNTQNVRRFMKARIPGFSFSIPLMDWMKANAGKTLADAVAEAERIAKEKRAGRKQPDQPHNQYNAYTRAYFDHVKDGSLAEVRRLWALRRKRRGPYVFDPEDLTLLDDQK